VLGVAAFYNFRSSLKDFEEFNPKMGYKVFFLLYDVNPSDDYVKTGSISKKLFFGVVEGKAYGVAP
jgi:hypothetical protein